jgi:voltage-gated potassium channel
MTELSAEVKPESIRLAKAPEQNRKSLAVLLISLATVLLVVPLAESVPYVEWLLRIGMTAVMFSAVVTTTRRGKLVWAGSIVAAMVIPLRWTTMLDDRPHLFLCTCVFECLFFGAMAVMIIVSVIRNYLTSIHSVFGAISAYLLLGLAWAVLYWGVNQVDATSLRRNSVLASTDQVESSAEVIQFSKSIYFSFVTMSTLGFGDITPATPIMQTFAWMQAVVGQFYMAVLVAWLVSAIPGSRNDMSVSSQSDAVDSNESTDS